MSALLDEHGARVIMRQSAVFGADVRVPPVELPVDEAPLAHEPIPPGLGREEQDGHLITRAPLVGIKVHPPEGRTA